MDETKSDESQYSTASEGKEKRDDSPFYSASSNENEPQDSSHVEHESSVTDEPKSSILKDEVPVSTHNSTSEEKEQSDENPSIDMHSKNLEPNQSKEPVENKDSLEEEISAHEYFESVMKNSAITLKGDGTIEMGVKGSERDGASAVCSGEIISLLDDEKVKVIAERQNAIFDLLQRSNKTLSSFNDLSEVQFAHISSEFENRIKLLRVTKSDLDVIFRRIRSLRKKIEAKANNT